MRILEISFREGSPCAGPSHNTALPLRFLWSIFPPSGFLPPRISHRQSRIGASAMRVVPLLIRAFACELLPAQEKLLPVLHFNHLTTADGLPSNEMRSPVVRDHSGYVWVGTENGLARYDGYGCKVYRNDPNDSTSSGHTP